MPRLPELKRHYCAAATPLDATGSAGATGAAGALGAVDADRLAGHAAWLIGRGCDGVALFGTTGEGASFTAAERLAALDAVLARGVEPGRVILGVLTPVAGEAAELVRAAAERGCAAALVAPPFYFHGAPEAGVGAFLRLALEAAAQAGGRVLAYHIPQVTGNPVPLPLLAALAEAFPGTLAGVKDSTGDRAGSLALIRALPDLAVYVGNEPDIAATRAAGGAGTICGVSNFLPELVARAVTGDAAAAEAATEALERVVAGLEGHDLIPALKQLTARRRGDAAWTRVRPPLVAVPAEGAAALTRIALPEAA